MEFTKEQLEQINKMIDEKNKKPDPKPKDPDPKPQPKPVEKDELDKEIEVAEKKLKLKKIQKETDELGKTHEDSDDMTFTINGESNENTQATDEDGDTISELTK